MGSIKTIKSIKRIGGYVLNSVKKGERVFVKTASDVMYTSRVTDVKYISSDLWVFETENNIYEVRAAAAAA